ncbi:E3 ubiquitin-protein ligase [Drechslerella dactyloides]|uniref:E3 ubiquitin-protein ligase n=1 Tax=Drechslerella dactyloides TaxID=74499 RepID=A0AAD6J1H9_DREDA|nr:E3 ubiquitin-protein ligase [Drechslerella dactyloides]
MATSIPVIPTPSASPTMAITVTSAPTPSPSSGGGGGGGSQNSPLLFFVALGFGVVFTNLWIIVGVKYCFRYNARNRARANGVDDVDLQAIGTRPHRRRREKKLMTVDEVNERFPVTKYKTWRANREVLGLSTTGGIAPAEGTTPLPTAETPEHELDPPASPIPKLPEPVADPTKPAGSPDRESQELPIVRAEADPPSTLAPDAPAAPVTSATPATPATPAAPATTRSSSEIHRVPTQQDTEHDDHDDEEPMPALPADVANSCGDTCAICIDNLEDSDDVRGLTCGHAFHTACIDPWLTARRACCPLCKADYYVPKPRTEAEIEAEEAARERRRQQAAEMHRHPLRNWWFRAETFLMPPGPATGNRSRRAQGDARRRSQMPAQTSRWNPFSRGASNGNDAPNPPDQVRQHPTTNTSAFLARFNRPLRSGNGSAPTAGAPATEEPTPRDLEAGLANTNATSNPR